MAKNERQSEREGEVDKRILKRCGFEVVPAAADRWHRFEGWCGHFEAHRGCLRWYWVVRGPMPVAFAHYLYAHPIGCTDIRVAGHCACPPPEAPWLTWRMPDGSEIVHDPLGIQAEEWDAHLRRNPDGVLGRALGREPKRFERDPAAVGAKAFVDQYHVDTEVGLYVLGYVIALLPDELLITPRRATT